MSELTTAASGAHTTDGLPHGFSTITPFIAVTDPAAAIDFYREVFGAREVSRAEMGGAIAHAELQLPQGRLQLGAPMPAYGLVAQPDGDSVSASFALYCPDVDATVQRAVEHGAVVREPVATWVNGDRFGSIRDPFGVRWTVMTRVEDLSDEEVDARVTAWAAEQG